MVKEFNYRIGILGRIHFYSQILIIALLAETFKNYELALPTEFRRPESVYGIENLFRDCLKAINSNLKYLVKEINYGN